jgi:(E)-4-hydroxy-3-methylbut-2-enyl-diphosphate synthase
MTLKFCLEQLETRFEGISEDLEVAIIGCNVNGPGESKAADVGLTGGPSNLLYVNGAPSKKVSNEKLVDTIEEQVKEQLEKKNSLDIIAKG